MDKHTYYITNNYNANSGGPAEYLKYQKETKKKDTLKRDNQKFEAILKEKDPDYKF